VNSDSSVGHPSLVEMTAKYLSGENRNSSTRALLIVILLIRRNIEIFGCKWWLISYTWNLNILGSEVVQAGAFVPRI
jgi:hypothetical protein